MTGGYHSEQCNFRLISSRQDGIGLESCRIDQDTQEILQKGNYYEFNLLSVDLCVLIWEESNDQLLTETLCQVLK